jgi:hypothetical protein
MILKELITLHESGRSGEAHFSPKGMGQFGEMLILDDTNPMIGKLAEALGLKDDWKIASIGGGLYGAYNSGDRLTIGTHRDDLVGDEEDDEDGDGK